MKPIYISILILSTITIGNSQQDIILSKYSFNSMFFNPAFAGSTGKAQGSAVLNYRDQWIGLEGSPTTILLGAEMNLFDDKIGLGINLAKESIGIDNRVDIQGNYAYRLDLDDAYLSLGIRAALHLFESELTEVIYSEPGDLIYESGDINFSVFSAGIGAYYYQDNFYAGLSIPALISVSGSKSAFKSRHIYFHTGAVYELNDYSNLQLEPSLLIKYEFSAPLQLTLGMQIWFIENLAFGVHYRSTDALGVSLEFMINDRISLGAAYDFTTSQLKKEHSNTLEFLASYKFGAENESMFNK